MSEQNPSPSSSPPVAPAPSAPLPLAELFPACFDWENPRPIKLGIHKDMLAAGLEAAGTKLVEVRRVLARYCNRPRYRRTLRAGAIRVDLHGQPAGVVTAAEADLARSELAIWKARRLGLPVPPHPSDATLPPNDTPMPKEHLVPGRLELTVKFSELPRPLSVQGGMKIGIQTAEGIVTAILPPKVWHKLEQAAKDYPHWVAVLSGSLDRVAEGEIALKHPALQVFEKKVKPEVPTDSKAPDAPTTDLPTEATAPQPATEPQSSPPPPSYNRPTLSLKGRVAPGKS